MRNAEISVTRYCYHPGMKMLIRTSGTLLFLSVTALEGAGRWWLVPAAVAACSLVACYLASRRLGYVDSGTVEVSAVERGGRYARDARSRGFRQPVRRQDSRHAEGLTAEQGNSGHTFEGYTAVAFRQSSPDESRACRG